MNNEEPIHNAFNSALDVSKMEVEELVLLRKILKDANQKLWGDSLDTSAGFNYLVWDEVDWCLSRACEVDTLITLSEFEKLLDNYVKLGPPKRKKPVDLYDTYPKILTANRKGIINEVQAVAYIEKINNK